MSAWSRVRAPDALAVLALSLCPAACGDRERPSEPARTPAPAPEVVLTAEERELWEPLPPDRSRVPVLLYHGVAPSGEGHQQIRYGPGEDDYGPFYAYREEGESLDGWRERTFSDIEWGVRVLAENVPGTDPLAFAPPYGNYGQDGTNDPAIPDELLPWLLDRFELVFTQDRSLFARPDQSNPFGRFQLSRSTTGGELYAQVTGG